MAIRESLEWLVEKAWLYALGASTDLVAELPNGASDIVRFQSLDSAAPERCLIVHAFPAAIDPDDTEIYSGNWVVPVRLEAHVAFDQTDTETLTGEAVARLLGGLQQLLEDSTLATTLEAPGDLHINGLQLSEDGVQDDDNVEKVRGVNVLTHVTVLNIPAEE